MFKTPVPDWCRQGDANENVSLYFPKPGREGACQGKGERQEQVQEPTKWRGRAGRDSLEFTDFFRAKTSFER